MVSSALTRKPPGRVRPLGRYLQGGREREVVVVDGPSRSRLVIDRLAKGGGELLVAALAADEPPANAAIVARHYLADPTRGRCRPVGESDLQVLAPEAAAPPGPVARSWRVQLQGRGRTFLIGAAAGQLRWVERSGRRLAVVRLRSVVGALERYEPALAVTRAALRSFAADRGLSTDRLSEELRRLETTPLVLNRRLREAVLAAAADGLSFSEIALRCGRTKRDRANGVGGATTWLARRVGLVAEHGAKAPSPWIHRDLLALIAREGLGLPPREVETE